MQIVAQANTNVNEHINFGKAQMPTAYFHIGQFKTGSSSIQSFLAKNHEQLQRQGYFSPKYPRAINIFTLRLFESFYQQKDPLEHEETRITLHEMRNHSLDLLYSSEYLGAFTHHLDKLKDVFSDFQHKIIIYLRRADDHFESVYNQLVRNHLITHDETIERYIELFNATEADRHLLIRKWADTFGKENIVVLTFNRDDKKEKLYDNFCNATGIKINQNFDIPTYKVNASLPIIITELLKEVNKIFFYDIEKANFIKSTITKAFRQEKINVSDKRTTFLTYEQREKIILASKPFDDKIAKEYLEKDSLFEYTINETNSTDQSELSAAEIKEILLNSLGFAFDEKNK